MMLQLLLVVLSLSQVFQADASDVYKQTFNFSNETQFADLSVYNFDKGLSYTYQYLITARANRKVTIYFLSNLMKNANVALYNGVDATAPLVDVSALYKIVMTDSEIIPVPITSKGHSFYMEVAPLTTDAGLQQDFQAIATDIVQPFGCGALIRAAGNARYSAKVTLAVPKVTVTEAAKECIHIIRTVDMNNDKNSDLRLEWVDEDVTTVVYKGLSMNPDTKLVTLRDESAYNEKNIIIQHKNAMTIEFMFTYDEGDAAVTYNSMQSKHTTMFITGDYYPARPVGATETFQRGYMFWPEIRVDSLRVNFLSGIGDGSVQVSYLNYQPGYQNKTVSYTKANLPKSLTIYADECYQFLLSYSCTGTACTGIYGTVEDATNL